MKKRYFIIPILLLVTYFLYQKSKKINFNSTYEVGQAIDNLNGVIVYHNGGVAHTKDRNLSDDGYNIGIRWQCVEFIKRYYYEYFNHKMPDTYGHAKHFFDASVKDGAINKARNLHQFTNPSQHQPKVDEILVIGATLSNRYGHVAIISKVENHQIEIIQQNSGPFGKSRINIPLTFDETTKEWYLEMSKIEGRLGLLK
jgi:hypothetical protein